MVTLFQYIPVTRARGTSICRLRVTKCHCWFKAGNWLAGRLSKLAEGRGPCLRGGAVSGRRSRSKGARTERGIVKLLQAGGIAEVRVPPSGAVGGRFAGDIVLPLLGRDLCVEVKSRADVFASCMPGWTGVTP